MKGNKALSAVRIAFMSIMALLFISPLFFTLFSSFKGNQEIYSTPFGLPKKVQFTNYVMAWVEGRIGQYFVNSLLISFATVVALIIVASMAAYIISRFKMKFATTVLVFFTLGLMIPMHTILVPVSFVIGKFDLKNNLVVLVLIYVAFNLSFSIMVLTNAMRSIDNAIEEAAVIDGANFFQIYRHVMIPLSMPGIATISIFNFLAAWNNVLFPLLFINDAKLKPISLGLLNFNGQYGSQYGPLMASIIITVSVPMLIYLLFQEKVESGLSAGAVK